MPGIVNHREMGKAVYNELPPHIAEEITEDIFNIALFASDPYSFYRFIEIPFKFGINRRSSVMHAYHTADFLVELARRSRSDKKMFSYLAGYLCHFALDSDAHPYINKRASNIGGMHMAIENRLDVITLKRLGKPLSRRPITKEYFPAFIPRSMRKDLNRIARKLYGWDDHWEKLGTGYRYMKLFVFLAEDPAGLVRATVGRLKKPADGKLAAMSYRSRMCDNMEFDEFDDLVKKAVADAKRYIETAYAYREGRISIEVFRGMIGTKDYSGNELQF